MEENSKGVARGGGRKTKAAWKDVESRRDGHRIPGRGMEGRLMERI